MSRIWSLLSLVLLAGPAFATDVGDLNLSTATSTLSSSASTSSTESNSSDLVHAPGCLNPIVGVTDYIDFALNAPGGDESCAKQCRILVRGCRAAVWDNTQCNGEVNRAARKAANAFCSEAPRDERASCREDMGEEFSWYQVLNEASRLIADTGCDVVASDCKAACQDQS